MFTIPQNLKISSQELRSIINVVYKKTKQFLQYPIHNHYTDHSIEHSIRVLNIISQLLDETKISLTNTEKYIIICATLLHDIGMQTPNFLTDKFELNITQLEEIRKSHHIFSSKMILDSINNDKDSYDFGLNVKREYVDLIAQVAQAHRKIDLSTIDNRFIAGEEIRTMFLAALLRLSDSLDIDRRRVNIDRLTSLNIPISSKLFWFRHQYVEGLKVDKQKLEVHFSFPDKYENDSIVNSVIDYTIKEIENQVEEVYDILDSYDLRLHKDIAYRTLFSPTQKKMTEDVVAYINTLGEDGVVKNDKIFDVYPTRDLCIDDIFKKINNICPTTIVFFGGISTRLCQEDSIKIFSDWLCKCPNANLFLCYEDESAAHYRAESLDIEALPKGRYPTEPHRRFLHKLDDVINCREKYAQSLQQRVHLVPLTKALNTYTIMVDSNYYCNILTAIRSSESTTAKLRNNKVGIKTKIELLSYMLFILSNSPKSEGNVLLKSIIELEKNKIK